MSETKTTATLPTPKLHEEVLALFGFGGLGDLKSVLPATVPARQGKGRRAAYPPLLQYGVAATARIYGSQRAALRELGADGVWPKVVEAYSELVDLREPLPQRPPSEEQQDRFVHRLASDPALMARLSEQFTASAVIQAQHLGNFPDTGVPDYARPDPRNVVFGDGTFYAPFSKVTEEVDAVTGERLVFGSRSKHGRPRVQRSLTDASQDDKNAKGVNHVTVSTRTDAGWVVLANGQALGAEVHAARALIAQVHTHLGERLHTVIWDRALSGWHVQDLMATHRVLTVTKPVAASRHFRRRHPALALSHSKAIARYESGNPLPLGTSVYPRDSGHDVVRSRYYQYGQPLNVPCSHDLWVDDGGLWDVETTAGGHREKVVAAASVRATPRATHAGWWVDIDWEMPCVDSGEIHEFTTTWNPRQGKAKPSADEATRALAELVPIPRSDERFRALHGARNNAESYHAWLKARLGTGPTRGRGARLAVEAQLLDHLCVGTLANAITAWRAHRIGLTT